jgi:hypothetical protein
MIIMLSTNRDNFAVLRRDGFWFSVSAAMTALLARAETELSVMSSEAETG